MDETIIDQAKTPRKETAEIADWQRRNLERNFPHYEVVITHDRVEKRFGKNFAQIMQELSEMDDTFGLCGVIADTSAGLLKSDSWQEVDYSVNELKEIFNVKTEKDDPTAWDVFSEKFARLMPEGFQYLAVLSPDDEKRSVPEITENLKDSQGNKIPILTIKEFLTQENGDKALGINVLCEYPKHEGTHTHWLAATAYEDGILLVGDLSPFGINAIGIKVNKQELERGMSAVIGSSPTTKLTGRVFASSITEGTMSSENKFTTNAFVMKTL